MLPDVTGAVTHPPSEALLAANRQLLAQRAGRPAVGEQPKPAETALLGTATSLPPHLGWGSQGVTAALRVHTSRASEVGTASVSAPLDRPVAEAASSPTVSTRTLTLAPDLALALLQTQQAAAGRLWLLCRALDETGRGWLPMAEVRAHLTGRRSPWRVCGQRRLRQLLKSGTGLFWERDKQERLWLYGAARVAAGLGVTQLRRRPLTIPCVALLGSLGRVRAELYATFHSSRRRPAATLWSAPISRASVARLTGTPARTQRLYERRLGLPRRANYAIGPRLTPEARQERCWQQGRGVFAWCDPAGRHGRPGGQYVAWRLPNSYGRWRERAPLGRQRKINQALTRRSDLVHSRAQGNGTSGQRQQRLFHPQGCAAGRAYNHAPHRDHYWPASSPGRVGLWYVLAGATTETRNGRRQ